MFTAEKNTLIRLLYESVVHMSFLKSVSWSKCWISVGSLCLLAYSISAVAATSTTYLKPGDYSIYSCYFTNDKGNATYCDNLFHNPVESGTVDSQGNITVVIDDHPYVAQGFVCQSESLATEVCRSKASLPVSIDNQIEQGYVSCTRPKEPVPGQQGKGFYFNSQHLTVLLGTP